MLSLTFNSNMSAFSRLRLSVRKQKVGWIDKAKCAQSGRLNLQVAPQRRHFFFRFVNFDVFLCYIVDLYSVATAAAPPPLVTLKKLKIRNILMVHFGTASASTCSSFLKCFS